MQVLVHPNRAGLLALCALIVGAANVPCCLIAAPAAAPAVAAPAQNSSPYTKGPKTRDGIGVYYFGREIAHYMTHHGAPWLERGEREIEERPDLVMKALALKPGDIVADLGCGTGYFSWRMAQAVAPAGIVLSHPTMITQASKAYAMPVSSIESAMTSREMRDAFMPCVPMVMPSEIEIVFTSIGVPPASRMPAMTCWASIRWLRLQGMVPIHSWATMTSGFFRSSGVNPAE